MTLRFSAWTSDLENKKMSWTFKDDDSVFKYVELEVSARLYGLGVPERDLAWRWWILCTDRHENMRGHSTEGGKGLRSLLVINNIDSLPLLWLFLHVSTCTLLWSWQITWKSLDVPCSFSFIYINLCIHISLCLNTPLST